jgi:hypothetical protein
LAGAAFSINLIIQVTKHPVGYGRRSSFVSFSRWRVGVFQILDRDGDRKHFLGPMEEILPHEYLPIHSCPVNIVFSKTLCKIALRACERSFTETTTVVSSSLTHRSRFIF